MKLQSEIILTLLVIVFLSFISIKSEDIQYPTLSPSLRILEINVWSGLDYKGYIKMGEYETKIVREKRYQALLTQIKQLDPDIISLHEVNKLPYYAKRLGEDIGYNVFYHVGMGGIRLGPIGLPWNLHEGDVILTKKYLHPQYVGHKKLSGGYVSNWATFNFSNATQVIGVKIIYKNIPVFIFATHWYSSLSNSPDILAKVKELYDAGQANEDEYQNVLVQIKKGVDWRLSESEKTIEFIQKTAGKHPFILMGDFNAESYSKEINNLLQFGMIDVFQTSNPDSTGYTWDPETNLNQIIHYRNEIPSEKNSNLYSKLEKFFRTKPKRIDYIFLGPLSFFNSQKISIKSSKVVMKEIISGIHTSDHYGIFAEIEMNN